MKKRKKKIHWQIAIFVFFLSLAIIAFFSSSGGVRGSTVAQPGGWMWNAFQPKDMGNDRFGLGWVSMSCLNDFDNDFQLENQCNTGYFPDKRYTLKLGSVNNGAFDGILDATGDYLQGCAWSSAYGWICFNGGSSVVGNTFQCDSGASPACADLRADGMTIKRLGYCSNTPTKYCNEDASCGGGTCTGAYFYYVDSPAYNVGDWENNLSDLAKPQKRAVILSLRDPLQPGQSPEQSYITFPFTTTTPASPVANSAWGCIGCDAATGKCKACLNVNTNSTADASANPNPNQIFWDCGNDVSGSPALCSIGNSTGSCSQNQDKNSCKPASCKGSSKFTGLVVNKDPLGNYEMCGWGYHAYADTAGAQNTLVKVDVHTSDNYFNGRYNAIAIGSDGLPVMSYIQQTGASTYQVKVAKCGDPTCISKRITIIEGSSSDVMPTQTAITVDAQNNPRIAYVMNSASLKQVRMAVCNDPACMSYTTRTIESGSSFESPAIAVYSGKPILTYYTSAGTAHLSIATCADSACMVVNSIIHADSGSDFGKISSIAIPPTGFPIISATNYVNLYAVKCNDAQCSVPVSQNISSVIPRSNDVVVDPTGIPLFVYYGSSSYKITYIRCNNNSGIPDPNCASGTTVKDLVTYSGVSDIPVSMALGADGLPVISYADPDKIHIRVIKCNDLNCSVPIYNDAATLPSGSGDVKFETSIAIGYDANPVITNFYEINTPELSLQIVKCGSTTCGSNNVSKGFGWLAVNSKHIGGLAYANAVGSILSGGNIYSPAGPPSNSSNAAYILEASGDIVNWFSQGKDSSPSQGTMLYPRGVGLPAYIKDNTSSEVYTNVLGKLDYKGLVTNVVTGVPVIDSDANPKNKYGSTLVFEDSDLVGGVNVPSNATTPLGDKVYYWGSSTYISGGTLGCASGTSGAGIFVVNGDLTINGNVTYGSCSFTKSKEIPSVVWIVRGDVTIGSNVSEVAGSFVVLGKDATASCQGKSLADPPGQCGRFDSGTSPLNALTVNGTVLAHQFKLTRSYSGSVCVGGDNAGAACANNSVCTGVGGTCTAGLLPAEKFVADGRLQANTPSGLYDFAKSMPRFSFGS